MLFSLWAAAPYRATGDLDLLGMGENAPEQLAAVFQEILAVAVDDDGIVFRPETLRAAAARAEDEYAGVRRSEEHTSELQSLMRNSYAVFCLKKNNNTNQPIH